MMVPDSNNELHTTYMGGGPFATLPPVFREDGTTIYIAWRNRINGYNCKTSRKVQEFIGLNEDIVGFGTIYKKEVECLVAATTLGNYCVWNISNGTRLIDNKLPSTDIKSFYPILDRTLAKFKAIIVFDSLVDSEDSATIETSQTKIALYNLKHGDLQLIPIQVKRGRYYLDVGEVNGGGRYLLFAQGKFLYYVDLELKETRGAFITRRHMLASPKQFTALTTPHTAHSSPNCITGDSMGRITLYTDLRPTRPIHSVLHWHALPVHALSLTAGDTRLYSGGEEGVLVKWAGLHDGERREFVPRLGGVIKWIGVGGVDGAVVGVDVTGQGVRITDGAGDVTWVRTMVVGSSSDVGLVYDNRSKCIILNGISGFIQFYSPSERVMLYSMDVVHHNRLSQERNKTLANINVKYVSVNENGSWYGTVEERVDTSAIYELRLKFWKFDLETQKFHLNTSIEYPHEQALLGIEFRPNRKGDKLDQCITISKDGLFKNWHLVEISGVDGALSLTWRCATTAYYKPPFFAKCLHFSDDGSVLALGFGPAITIWLPDTCQLKRSLTYDNNLTGESKSVDFIESVAFGKGRCNYLIVGATKNHLMIWNLLNYTLISRIQMDIAALIPDPSSCIMAVLKKNNTVCFFEPDQSEPIVEFKIPEEVLIKRCTFVPMEAMKENLENRNSKIKSQFFYLNSKHEMYCLGSAIKTSENAKENFQIDESNFSRLLAEKLTTSVKKLENQKIIHENPNKKSELKMVLDTPNQTQMPMSLIACSFLHSLVLNENASSEQHSADVTSNCANNIQYGPVENGSGEIAEETGPHSGTCINFNKMKIKDKDWVNQL